MSANQCPTFCELNVEIFFKEVEKFLLQVFLPGGQSQHGDIEGQAQVWLHSNILNSHCLSSAAGLQTHVCLGFFPY